MSELCGIDRSPDIDDLIRVLMERDPLVALAATVDLTYRCNFACTHCYCRLPVDGPTPVPELTFAEWDRILGEAADEGLLFLTLTGGEPLIREDFADLWRMAKRRGFLCELFTNGSLIDESIADLLAEYTPKQVSMTVYAASEETYASMTGCSGMHERVLGALDLLAERGIPIEVKGLFSRQNAHEFDAISKQALQYDELVRWQAELVGCYTEGGGNPCGVGLSPEELVALELADPIRSGEWRSQLANRSPSPANPDSPFRCQLGNGRFHLDPYGNMRPCMLLQSVNVDCRSTSVRQAWREDLPRALADMPWQPSACNVCELADVCRACPAKFLLAGQPAGGPYDVYCEIARTRARAYGIPARPASADSD